MRSRSRKWRGAWILLAVAGLCPPDSVAMADEVDSANLIRDASFEADDAWTATHSPEFRDVGPLRTGGNGYGFGVIESPRGTEQSTVSQTVSVEKGRRYLLTFRYQTGTATPPPAGYQALFVDLDGQTAWTADLAVPDFPPRTARLLFEAKAERVTLTIGKRAIKPGNGWNFPSSVFDVALLPATAEDKGETVVAGRVIEAPLDGPRWTARVGIEDRFVTVGESCVVDVVLEGADDVGIEERRGLLRKIELEFPGFDERERRLIKEDWGLRVRGRIVRPGFLPFRVVLKARGGRHVRADHVMGVPENRRDPGAFANHGYYVFLSGKGPIAGNRLAAWKLDDWKRLVDWMHAHGANQIWLTFNCYWLAYPSRLFPDAVDQDAQNVQQPFVKELVDYAHAKQVRVYAAYTLDDYSEGFAQQHPELLSIDSRGRPRKGVLCLEKPEVRKYLLGVVRECFELYPKLDGIVVHPNESGSQRFNDETKQAYLQDTGSNFDRSSAALRAAWYANQTGRMIGEMHEVARNANPRAECVAFEVPELIPHMRTLKDALPPKARICCWHYPHHGTHLKNPKIRDWADVFGDDQIFMPNGFDYGYPSAAAAQLHRHIANDRLLSAAHSHGYDGAVYYVHHVLDSEPDRLRDLLMAKYPTSSWVADPVARKALLSTLHEHDTITVRQSLGRK